MKTIDQSAPAAPPKAESQDLKREVSRTGEEISKTAQELKDQTLNKGAKIVDEQSSQAGQALSSITEASRAMSQKLSENGQNKLADGVSSITQQLEKGANYLQTSSGDRIVNDLRKVASNHPVATMAGLFGMGLIAGRILRASTPNRSQDSSAELELKHLDQPTLKPGDGDPESAAKVEAGLNQNSEKGDQDHG